MFEEKKEYCYVSKDIADLIHAGEDVDTVKNAIKQKFSDRATWFAMDLEQLEDAASRFKAIGAIHKAELEKAMQAQDAVLLALSEKVGDLQSKALKKAREVNAQIKEVVKTVEALEREPTHAWKMDRLMDTVERVQCMDDGTKKLLAQVLSIKTETQKDDDDGRI